MNVTIRANCWDGVRSKTFMEQSLPQVPEVVQVQDTFMDKLKRGARRLNDPTVKAILGYGIPLMLLAHGIPAFGMSHALSAAVPAMAMSGTAKEKILHAFDPLINLIQSLAYPIAGVMIAGGCLFIMVGNREKGMQMLQNAAIGYILVQLSPMLLSLLVGIGAGV